MWDRKKRGVEDGSKNFNISNWKNAVAIYLDGEAWNRSLIGGKIRNLGFGHAKWDIW